MLEVQQKQRRSSMQMRRTSLAEVIPDWPLLQKAKVAEKVHVGARTAVAATAGNCPVIVIEMYLSTFGALLRSVRGNWRAAAYAWVA